jgi:hypothetical protein
MDLYIDSSIRLHGLVFNYLGTTLFTFNITIIRKAKNKTVKTGEVIVN